MAQDILQNTFLKVHEHLDSLKDPAKAKPWIFQIARNELASYFKGLPSNVPIRESKHTEELAARDDFCCFDRFLEELPTNYKSVISLVYLDGKTNLEAADILNLSLANIKARIRRAKRILKQRFQDCCAYRTNESDQLVGESDCVICNGM